MRANPNRGIIVVAAMVVGLIFGLCAGAYVFYAWVPAEAILKNTSPKFLNYDPVSMTPQYRDFYIVRAATKYQRDLQSGISDPLKGAYDVLGVTTGDLTMDEALTLVRYTEKVANKENNVDGDAGQFTRNEELAIGALAGALDQALQSGVYPKFNPAKYAPLQALTTVRIVGFILLLVLLAVCGFVVVYLNKRFSNPETSTTHLSKSNRIIESAPHNEPEFNLTPPPSVAPVDTPHNATVNMNPTSPGSAPSFLAASARQATPLASSELPIETFTPTIYRNGDDHYDVDFPISGPLGELIGECGASIADRIGLDSPARVSALALWVFDKTDFQSTTKILFTHHAYFDTVTRAKLKARGDAVEAIDGGVVEILTSLLRVEIQVSDMVLNSDNNPAQGYFQSVSLTFRVFKRPLS
ncbi:MAG TPA: hypothetical protein VGK87_16130 [Anaerolineae bacterium]